MSVFKGFFASRKGIIAVGVFIGILAPILQKLGNPGNMGICVACFERDMAGAVGLQRAAVVQYMRPEIIGFVIGAMIAALIFREFRPRVGSAPIVRFMLGMVAMIGALVFLGCPWRALLRLAGGDGNAIAGLAGLAVGVYIGTLFFKSGYNLGRAQSTRSAAGFILPAIALGALVLMLVDPQIPGQPKSGVLFYSIKGPGAMHAPLIVSLVVGLAVGIVAQRSRFCTMGALRDLMLFKQIHLFSGFMAMLVAAFFTNLVLNQFHPGFVH
jgi:YedE family putative selenium metabolism protein